MKSRRHCVLHLHLWLVLWVTIKYNGKCAVQSKILVFFNYFPHSQRLLFHRIQIIVTDSHCLNWRSERRFDRNAHTYVYDIKGFSILMNAHVAFFEAVSLIFFWIKSDKIVICVNFCEHRNQIWKQCQLPYPNVVNQCILTPIRTASEEKKNSFEILHLP